MKFETTDVPLGARNDAHLALMRRLVPLNFTRGTRYRHDPGVPIPPLPMLSAAGELDRYPAEAVGFALVQLERGRNHVAATIDNARECLEAVCGRGALLI